MHPSVTTDAALAPLRIRFQLVSQQVSGWLGAIRARLHELREPRHSPLLAVVHNLESMQMQLCRLVEQLSHDGVANHTILETAIRNQLELLGQVTSFAERIGLHGPETGDRAAA